jgi:putative membrane protein
MTKVNSAYIFAIALFGMVTIGFFASSLMFAGELLDSMPVFGYLYISLFAVVGFYIAKFIFDEVTAYLEFSKIDSTRAQAKRFLDAPSIYGEEFVKSIVNSRYKKSNNAVILSTAESFTIVDPKNAVDEFSNRMLSIVDDEAQKVVFKYAGKAGAITAISPNPIIDMMILLFVNIKMVNEIVKLYGFRAGISGNIKILTRVAEQLAFLGASEIASGVAQSFTAKIAAAVAQGTGNAIFTARVGIAAMEVVRPVEKKITVSGAAMSSLGNFIKRK